MKLGIPSDATVCLVSLGAGEINDISNLRDFVVEGLTKRGIYAIIADSMLKPMKAKYQDEKVRVVQSFPIMRSRNECLLLRLPSIIIPNSETSRDDQPGRASKASETGGAMVVEEAGKEIIELALERICDSKVRSEMAERLVMNFADDGADLLAEGLIGT